MPRGTRYSLTGTLRWDARRRTYALMMEDGGWWQLDVLWPARRLIGCEVTVEGIRSGFNLIDVTSLRRAGTEPPQRWWRAVLTSLSARFARR